MKPSLILILILLLPGVPALPAGPRLEFNRDIRPILSDNCFACHGPDGGKRKADLRLDTRDGLLGKIEDRSTVEPGSPAGSEVFRRITASSDDDRMPPPSTGKRLTAAQVETIRRWIEDGAGWQGHWAYIAPVRSEPAPVRDEGGFVRGEIDRFILARLEAERLRPSPPADPVTLLRRLTFDLTGLPPSPETVEEFLKDPSAAAHERQVDELLASPHYGERMAIHWLDLVRYADSVGYHGDQVQSTYPFRDYVIRAFNDNMSFDRFTLEQIAGDLLPGATIDQRVAAGYNRLNMMSAEGGGQDREYLARYASDRVRATSTAWLGATLGCAECHDHKFDPYTTRDFYSFAAFFADVSEKGIYSGSNDTGEWGPTMKVPTREQAAEMERLDRELAAARGELDRPSPEVDAAQSEWEKSIRAADWKIVKPLEAASAGGAKLTVLDDGSVLAGGAKPDTDTYTVSVPAPAGAITAFRIEALPHDSLPKKGSGRAANGNFVLTEVTVQAAAAGGGGVEKVPLESATATFEQKSGGEKTPHGKWSPLSAIDGDARGAAFGWAVLEEASREQHAVFEAASDLSPGEGARLTFILAQNHGAGSHTLGRFRISVTSSPRPVRASSVPEKLLAIVATPPAARSETQRAELAAYYRGIAPALEPIRSRVEALSKSRKELESRLPRMLETVAVPPRMMRVLPRGNWMREDGEPVRPAVPAFLAAASADGGERATRLDLARWITSPSNPLTARVFVNRLWKLFFGAGISRRLDDLGAQGDWPSHPELLDWLALEFQEGGWDVKRIVRKMVLSGAYRQSSLAGQELRERDPYNRWLARQARFRLDAEMVRDNALAVSGLLVRSVGGPSVRPYQPPGYWAYLNFPMREYQNDTGENQYRRGLYTHWQRQYLHPSLLLFDAPSREECTAERPRSNTPLQALVLLNDPTYVEAARVFAEKVVREGGASPVERIRWAFRRALSRDPEPREANVLEALREKHARYYGEVPGAARELLATGLHPAPSDLDAAELAAWTGVTRAILNLHETITRS